MGPRSMQVTSLRAPAILLKAMRWRRWALEAALPLPKGVAASPNETDSLEFGRGREGALVASLCWTLLPSEDAGGSWPPPSLEALLEAHGEVLRGHVGAVGDPEPRRALFRQGLAAFDAAIFSRTGLLFESLPQDMRLYLVAAVEEKVILLDGVDGRRFIDSWMGACATAFLWQHARRDRG